MLVQQQLPDILGPRVVGAPHLHQQVLDQQGGLQPRQRPQPGLHEAALQDVQLRRLSRQGRHRGPGMQKLGL